MIDYNLHITSLNFFNKNERQSITKKEVKLKQRRRRTTKQMWMFDYNSTLDENIYIIEEN